MNARTANKVPDIIDTVYIDDHRVSTLTDDIDRKSQDDVLNEYGKMILSLCFTFGVCMLNGIVKGDSIGLYTFIKETGNSVNDYMVTSWDLFQNIISMEYDFSIDERIESDHQPVTFTLYLNKDANVNNVNGGDNDNKKIEKYEWNNDKADIFMNGMKTENASRNLKEAELLIETDVNTALHKFNDIIREHAKCMKRNVVLGKKRENWFDSDCYSQRKNVRKQLRAFRKSNTTQNRDQYCKARKEYKNLLYMKKKTFYASLLEKLINTVNDGQSFWQAVGKLAGKKKQPSNNKTLENRYSHFKQLLKKMLTLILKKKNSKKSISIRVRSTYY